MFAINNAIMFVLKVNYLNFERFKWCVFVALNNFYI